ncbi:hypothetical protein EV182_001603 [Spiromyces aspiralis]|uniref:Uncharacterized protein n=1 Tax=Spiromyces aspiralis TaxID=68401 RepID=A0ACC1HFC4_9FUNG|nr:hypothetical protein EV182_001603 [Spiromyces aspiralis]
MRMWCCRASVDNVPQFIDIANKNLRHAKATFTRLDDRAAFVPGTIRMDIRCGLEYPERKLLNVLNLLVKASHESAEDASGSLYNVFSVVGQHINDAWKFAADKDGRDSTELTIKMLGSLLTFIDSYHNLFSAKCVVCSSGLKYELRFGQFLPPTWRRPPALLEGPETVTVLNRQSIGKGGSWSSDDTGMPEPIHHSCLG